ncbi:MAG TPA: hypothetical protein VGD54_02390, partial [Steroidobacteraceae bacterium]
MSDLSQLAFVVNGIARPSVDSKNAESNAHTTGALARRQRVWFVDVKVGRLRRLCALRSPVQKTIGRQIENKYFGVRPTMEFQWCGRSS